MRNTVVMLVLAILAAAATWIATWQREDASAPIDPIAEAEPLGYYAKGARLSGTDDEGRPTYHIFAERLDELPGEARLQLTGVDVRYQPAEATAWTVSAASAKYARDGSQLDLSGDVEVRSMPTDGSRPMTVVTEILRFSADTSSAESDEPVEIDVGDLQLRGVGLHLDLKGSTLKLESEVHGTIVP